MWSVPINVPFTRYNRSLRASARIQNILKEIVQKKKIELKQNAASARQDLISFLLGMVDEDGKQVMSEKEIFHNIKLVMVAGHDTSAVLITFIIRLLANEPAIYAVVLQGMHQQSVCVKAQEEQIFVTSIVPTPLAVITLNLTLFI